jgi:NCAIR mutase (PurE)-related protein
VLVTRMPPEAEPAALAAAPHGRYDPISRTFTAPAPGGVPEREGLVAVVCAGTTDIPIAEEACATAHLVVLQEPNVVEAFRTHAAPRYVISHGQLIDQAALAKKALAA